MKLSKIEVTFERTKQIQQYEPAKASVTIGYVFDEDSDTNGEAVTAYALDLAKNRVAEALGLKLSVEGRYSKPAFKMAEEAMAAEAVKTPGLAAPHSPQSASGTVEAVKTEANPTVVSIPEPVSSPSAVAEPKKRGRPAGSKNKVDPAAMEEEPSSVLTSAMTQTIANDPAAMEDIVTTTFTPDPTTSVNYTAADLARAISNRVTKMVQAKIANPSDKIKAYIETWRPLGVTGPVSAIYQHVPEDKRAEFLAKLEEVV